MENNDPVTTKESDASNCQYTLVSLSVLLMEDKKGKPTMKVTNTMKTIGVVGAALSACVSSAGTNTPTQSVDARIAALEQQVAQLKADNSANWLNDERAEEIRALVSEVMGDASKRTSLLAGGGTAGWDKHFYLASDDGSFKLNIKGVVQTRAVWNTRDNSGDDDSIFGFEMRRAKIYFAGNLFGSDFTYQINGAFSRKGGAFELEDAWGAYQINDMTKVKWGQFKAPFLREELTSSSAQVAVDRSYVNELTTGNRIQGVQVDWHEDQFRVLASWNSGWGFDFTGTNSGGENTGFSGDGTDVAFTARGEFLAAGDNWKQFEDFQSWADDEFGMLIGGAIHYQKGETGTVSPETDVLAWTVDASAEFGGAHVEAWVVGESSDSSSTSVADYDQIGFVVTGGVFLIPDELELFGRWEYYDFDGALAAGFDDQINLFTVGTNYFWEGHNKKWTTDIVFAGDSIPDGSSGIGIEKDAVGQDGQIIVRSQLQFKF